MTLKVVRNIFLGLAMLGIVSLVSYRLGSSQQEIESVKNITSGGSTLMDQVKFRLETKFLEKDKLKDNEKMEYGAIVGMVQSLEDPYTVFLPPKDNKSTHEELAGTFGGVGISLGYKDKTLAVMSALTNTPAEKAGVKSGDLILKITDKVKKVDKDTSGISLADAVDLIRGKVGTTVTLKMFREGDKETKDVVLTRENIVVPSMVLEFKQNQEKTVAWIAVNKFSEQIYKDWPEAVKKIKGKMTDPSFGGVVLDLRNNPGGFLDAAVLVASDFLNSGVVVKQEAADGSSITYEVLKEKRNLLNVPLVVLINGGSASASEILAGALRDSNRAKLIGEKSFGKGTVQQPEDFADGSGLHVTVARWLLPSGVNIHGVGVSPDVAVTWDSDATKTEQYQKVYDTLLNVK